MVSYLVHAVLGLTKENPSPGCHPRIIKSAGRSPQRKVPITSFKLEVNAEILLGSDSRKVGRELGRSLLIRFIYFAN